MPFRSEAQRRYFEANREKLQRQGVNVSEWEEASKGLTLPERSRPSGLNGKPVKYVKRSPLGKRI